jgi:hypothetical protein
MYIRNIRNLEPCLCLEIICLCSKRVHFCSELISPCFLLQLPEPVAGVEQVAGNLSSLDAIFSFLSKRKTSLEHGTNYGF